jgi:hypothetical protein
MITSPDAYRNCKHGFKKTSRFICSNGAVKICNQCETCGKRVGDFIKKNSFSKGTTFDHLPVFNVEFRDEMAKKCGDMVREEYKKKRADEESDWWDWYNGYLQTSKWKTKRRFVLSRDPLCQACLTHPSTEAHHLTYKHVGEEPLFDLIGVCKACHKKITQLDRDLRQTL